ncbi:hypothetical protein LTR05_001570 [Lithohypha guttulata]|uniref:Uncharacterized protein n=1 Tax=Lithohypha guttulata TaxID=1690604 RepID=A0AAN7T7Q1_9EURO|nr:hypothetical protein LTR05_001570 [Lithohypha guttulata]
MAKFDIPAAGLQIQHAPQDPKAHSQIIRLNLPAKEVNLIVKHIKDGGETRVRTGRNPKLIAGTKQVFLHNVADKYSQEMFSGLLNGSKPLYFSGKLSHTLEIQQAREATSGMDEALEKLKNNLKQSQEDRSGTPDHAHKNRLLVPQHRSSALAGMLSGSRPSSPFLSAGFSPRVGPTSAPLSGGQLKEEKVKQAAIKIPMIHLLAIEAQEPKQLAEKLRVKKADLDQVLVKVAQDGKAGKKELRDRAYRDLDVWKFPYQSQNDRQSAIDHAVSAYDRLRIDKNDNLWQMLLAKEDRNKGIFLSRLNFDKPLTTGNLTPRLTERSTDGGSTEGRSMKSATSDSTNQKGKVPIAKVTDVHPKGKPNAEKLVKSLKNFGKETSVAKVISKVGVSASRQEVKYKSSEKIEDSDEEAGATPLTTTKRQESKQPITKHITKSSSPLVKSTSHKSHIPGLSNHSTSDHERGRIPSSAMVRTRGGKDTVQSADLTKPEKPSKSLEAHPYNVSRARNGSSPAKPSPLGSSPPTNSRDIDSTSTSSKGTSLSSAPSSPPSTTQSSQKTREAYSPSTIKANRPEKHINGVKRKSENDQELPPAKKKTLTNGKNDPERFNSLPKSLENEDRDRPPIKRTTSDSDSSSEPEKSKTKDKLVEDTKVFQQFYNKYKTLHDKLHKLPAQERDDADLDKVWKMHLRLKEMKNNIWKDWDKLEKAGQT